MQLHSKLFIINLRSIRNVNSSLLIDAYVDLHFCCTFENVAQVLGKNSLTDTDVMLNIKKLVGRPSQSLHIIL